MCNITLFTGSEQSFYDSLTTLDLNKKQELWNNHQNMWGLKFGLMDCVERLDIIKPKLSGLLQDRIGRIHTGKRVGWVEKKSYIYKKYYYNKNLWEY